jgi:hypothetical protein
MGGKYDLRSANSVLKRRQIIIFDCAVAKYVWTVVCMVF